MIIIIILILLLLLVVVVVVIIIKIDVRLWTGLLWLGKGYAGVSTEHDNEVLSNSEGI
jgi:hypothetical protein